MNMQTGTCCYCGAQFTYKLVTTERRYCSPEHQVKAQTERRVARLEGATERWCPQCQAMKPVGDFSSPTAPYCKPHMAERTRAYRAANPDPLRSRRDSLHRHGLTFEEFDALFDTQGRRCAICSTTEVGDIRAGHRGWHMDHDHGHCPGKWGCEVCRRGVICSKCNRGLGLFGEDPDRLDAAASYLRAHSARIGDGHVSST